MLPLRTVSENMTDLETSIYGSDIFINKTNEINSIAQSNSAKSLNLVKFKSNLETKPNSPLTKNPNPGGYLSFILTLQDSFLPF